MRKNYYLTIPFTRMYCTLCHDIQLARTCSLCQIQDKSSYTHSLCIGCRGLAPLLLTTIMHTLATKTLGRSLLEVGMALPFLQIQLYPSHKSFLPTQGSLHAESHVSLSSTKLPMGLSSRGLSSQGLSS